MVMMNKRMPSVQPKLLHAMRDFRLYTTEDLAYYTRVSEELLIPAIRKALDNRLLIKSASLRGRMCYQITEVGLKYSPDPALMPPDPPRKYREDAQTCYARTCFSHLGGFLGVQLRAAMLTCGDVVESEQKPMLTEVGKNKLIRLKFGPLNREIQLKNCIDGTERRFHLSGVLATRLTQFFFQQNWIKRGRGRSVIITDLGYLRFKQHFDLTLRRKL